MLLNCPHWCSILKCSKLWSRKFKILLWTLEKYTSHTFILDIIKSGLKLDYNEISFQHCCNNFPLSKEEMSITNSEIQKLRSKKVIINTDKRTGDYISGVFTRSKKDGSHRMILNLKNFNKFICYRYFKMVSIQNVLNEI